MQAKSWILAAAIALCVVPAGSAATWKELRSEEARLIAVVNAQRARIQQLQSQIRMLSPSAAPVSLPGDETLRPGITGEELRAVRGEPTHIIRHGGRIEIWTYGTTRVTLLGGRVASWQVGAVNLSPTGIPAGKAHASPFCDDDTPLPPQSTAQE